MIRVVHVLALAAVGWAAWHQGFPLVGLLGLGVLYVTWPHTR